MKDAQSIVYECDRRSQPSAFPVQPELLADDTPLGLVWARRCSSATSDVGWLLCIIVGDVFQLE